MKMKVSIKLGDKRNKFIEVEAELNQKAMKELFEKLAWVIDDIDLKDDK